MLEREKDELKSQISLQAEQPEAGKPQPEAGRPLPTPVRTDAKASIFKTPSPKKTSNPDPNQEPEPAEAGDLEDASELGDRDNEVEPAASSVAKPGALKPDDLPERVNSTTHRKEYMRLEARQLLCLRTYTYKCTDHSLIQEPPV